MTRNVILFATCFLYCHEVHGLQPIFHEAFDTATLPSTFDYSHTDAFFSWKVDDSGRLFGDRTENLRGVATALSFATFSLQDYSTIRFSCDIGTPANSDPFGYHVGLVFGDYIALFHPGAYSPGPEPMAGYFRLEKVSGLIDPIEDQLIPNSDMGFTPAIGALHRIDATVTRSAGGVAIEISVEGPDVDEVVRSYRVAYFDAGASFEQERAGVALRGGESYSADGFFDNVSVIGFGAPSSPPDPAGFALRIAPDISVTKCGTSEASVSLTNRCLVYAMSFGLAYDPQFIEPVEVRPTPIWCGKEPRFMSVSLNASAAGCESAGAGLTFAVVGDPEDPSNAVVPLGLDQVAAMIVLRAASGAAVFDETRLDFVDCLVPGEGSPPTPCVITCETESVRPAVKEGGVITVVDGTCFRRGYCNADSLLDISDAVSILVFLFGKGFVPPCMKSCDANDDGSLDLSDGIFLLGYLFQGGQRPPGPSDRCDHDPTADNLTCEASSHCR